MNIIPGTVESIVKHHSSEHVNIIKTTLAGFSEVFIIPSVWAGLLILIGILIDSRKATVYAILGNVLGFVIVAMLGGNVNNINQGLLLTVLLNLGLNTILEPIGLPSVTMPFILATWIMLFAGRPHRNIENKN